MGARPRLKLSGPLASLIQPIMARHGITLSQWHDSIPAAQDMRAEVAHALHRHGWTTRAIARAIGVNTSTARRYLDRPCRVKHTIDPVLVEMGKPPEPVQIRQTDGPTMIAKPGERRDCARESECLRTLLRSYDPHAPPPHASCPRGCPHYRAPDLDLRRYDATRRPGGAPSVP